MTSPARLSSSDDVPEDVADFRRRRPELPQGSAMQPGRCSGSPPAADSTRVRVILNSSPSIVTRERCASSARCRSTSASICLRAVMSMETPCTRSGFPAGTAIDASNRKLPSGPLRPGSSTAILLFVAARAQRVLPASGARHRDHRGASVAGMPRLQGLCRRETQQLAPAFVSPDLFPRRDRETRTPGSLPAMPATSSPRFRA